MHHPPLLPAGVRLTVDTVFKLLKKTNKEWDWLAYKILLISDSKRREIAARCSTTDDSLKESIRFWMKRFPYASYRWIIFLLNFSEISDVPQEMHHLLEPIQGKNKLEVLNFDYISTSVVSTVSCKLLFFPCSRKINVACNDIDRLPVIYLYNKYYVII